MRIVLDMNVVRQRIWSWFMTRISTGSTGEIRKGLSPILGCSNTSEYDFTVLIHGKIKWSVFTAPLLILSNFQWILPLPLPSSIPKNHQKSPMKSLGSDMFNEGFF